MDTLESSLKDIRGTVEVNFRDIRVQLEQLAASALAEQSETSVDVKQFQSEMIRLSDAIQILNQRITRTLELTSDVEFRVLRLEKRMQTLMSLSGEGLTEQLAQQDVVAAQQTPTVSIGRDADTGETIWKIEEDELNAQMEVAQKTAQDKEAEERIETEQGQDSLQIAAAKKDEKPKQASINEEAEPKSVVPEHLPEASPEEQYRFALARALQNDLQTAENAFVEFFALHPEHERAVDALFWQGRVQFIQGQYEKAATTFSKFNSVYSSDPRIADTTLWIAESVAKFANPEQACAIYDNLRQFVDQPPESFVARIEELSASAGCSS
jgi:TolA-binding protein